MNQYLSRWERGTFYRAPASGWKGMELPGMDELRRKMQAGRIEQQAQATLRAMPRDTLKALQRMAQGHLLVTNAQGVCQVVSSDGRHCRSVKSALAAQIRSYAADGLEFWAALCRLALRADSAARNRKPALRQPAPKLNGIDIPASRMRSVGSRMTGRRVA